VRLLDGLSRIHHGDNDSEFLSESCGGGAAQPSLRKTKQMALEHWTGKTADGEKAEYFYNQTDRGVGPRGRWAITWRRAIRRSAG
jgi:hypothetical protein